MDANTSVPTAWLRHMPLYEAILAFEPRASSAIFTATDTFVLGATAVEANFGVASSRRPGQVFCVTQIGFPTALVSSMVRVVADGVLRVEGRQASLPRQLMFPLIASRSLRLSGSGVSFSAGTYSWGVAGFYVSRAFGEMLARVRGQAWARAIAPHATDERVVDISKPTTLAGVQLRGPLGNDVAITEGVQIVVGGQDLWPLPPYANERTLLAQLAPRAILSRYSNAQPGSNDSAFAGLAGTQDGQAHRMCKWSLDAGDEIIVRPHTLTSGSSSPIYTFWGGTLENGVAT